ncbi:hypothetical protein RAS1_10760 [Phycisphaerae bacterium RAS1]|nr:hypothetical protein RAS1_10760 [Phycisphaerae bacterium RAS1]
MNTQTRIGGMTAELDALLLDGEPNWEAVSFEVRCPRCDYNLMLLTTPRCPECGLTFEWRRMLDQEAGRSRFLFEHHWRDRPVRSYFGTLWRALRPRSFWRQVALYEKVESGPLWFVFLTSMVTPFVLFHALAAVVAGVLALVARLAFGEWPGFPGSWVFYSPYGRYGRSTVAVLSDYAWDLAAAAFTAPAAAYGLMMLAAGLYACGVLALLCGLWQTLGRCRVRRVQLLRVCAYSAMAVSWTISPLFLALLLMLLWMSLAGLRATIDQRLLLLGVAWVLGYSILSVGGGLSLYLRLTRAWIVTATVVLVAFLAAFTLAVAAAVVR